MEFALKNNMKNEQVEELVNKYFHAEGYRFPVEFEHRVDPDSSAVMYSFIREYKPKNILGIGTWRGGSTCVMMAAALKNGTEFNYIASELEPDLRNETKENCIRVNGVAPTMVGDITKVLDDVPRDIDFLYHDTNHDLDTTVWVLDNILPRVKKGGLILFHDWAVEDVNGKWVAKDGAWPETLEMIDRHEKGTLPMEKVYWNYKNPGQWELGVFRKI